MIPSSNNLLLLIAKLIHFCEGRYILLDLFITALIALVVLSNLEDIEVRVGKNHIGIQFIGISILRVWFFLFLRMRCSDWRSSLLSHTCEPLDDLLELEKEIPEWVPGLVEKRDRPPPPFRSLVWLDMQLQEQ